MIRFSVARLPRIEFGAGSLAKLPALTEHYGDNALLVTGNSSFQASSDWSALLDSFKSRGISCSHVRVAGEPSPNLVDDIVRQYADKNINVVVGIGGGSALDTAKAIAGLLLVRDSVMDYLEGVGPEKPYAGPAVPFIAVPTTAGTGSEATKNAVLSLQGDGGFKKSFRDDQLVAQHAIVDPDLLQTCPSDVIAANGMDALTQLIESYVSLNANVFTDSLAIRGLESARDGLVPLYESEGRLADAREKMSYAALISGITLAQVGLGSVHGLASPLGAFYPVPHGVVCGTLVAAATEMNINSMLSREPENVALEKYAHVGEILCNQPFKTPAESGTQLVNLLNRWTEQLRLPTLSRYGLNETGLDAVVQSSRGSSMKTNPIILRDEEILGILKRRLR